MRNPKVSVIMASYNHEKYITRAIESVIAQTYDNWEMFIIDDCSSDNSAQLIEQYQSSKIKFFQAKENRGPIFTFNQLLEKAQGAYVAILGSDDVWYPDKLQKQVNYMENSPHIGACFSHAQFIDEKGNIYLDSDEVEFNINIFNQSDRTQGECFRYFFEYGNYFCHPSSIVRSSIINEIGKFDYRFRQLHDYHYWVRLLQKYPVHVIQEPLLYYRRLHINNTSVSAGSEKNTVRLYNESQIIIYEMIKDMKMDIFCEAFSDLIRKEIRDEIQLICEKFFVLLKWQLVGNNNRLMAIRYLNDYINNEEIMRCLKEDYKYTLYDYFQETGNKIKLYPIQFYEEYQGLVEQYEIQKNKNVKLEERMQRLDVKAREYLNELQVMRQTTSWRITKPLREMKAFLMKFKMKSKCKGTVKR